MSDEQATPEDISKREINICTSDLAEVRFLLSEIIKGLGGGPKSRARSLVITKLEEASLWAGEAMRVDP